jgi:hypothetical protein
MRETSFHSTWVSYVFYYLMSTKFVQLALGYTIRDALSEQYWWNKI